MLSSGSHSALLDFLAFLLGTDGGTPVIQQIIVKLIIRALDWRVAHSIYDYNNGFIVIYLLWMRDLENGKSWGANINKQNSDPYLLPLVSTFVCVPFHLSEYPTVLDDSR